jgi:Zn-dependent M28 family amino/carboxypeptidase
LGTGALDDGAGVAIVTAAAKLIADLPEPPKRSIRVVLYGAEEVGLKGAFAYADRHKQSLEQIAVAAESDFGAGRIWRFDTKWPEEYMPMKASVMRVLGPLGVAPGNNESRGGPDLFPLRPFGVPVVTLLQDGTDYFDYHHTPDDTLDKIDRADLAQNVAVYAAFAYLMAELDYDFRASDNKAVLD